MKTNVPVTNQYKSVWAFGTGAICIDNMSNNMSKTATHKKCSSWNVIKCIAS